MSFREEVSVKILWRFFLKNLQKLSISVFFYFGFILFYLMPVFFPFWKRCNSSRLTLLLTLPFWIANSDRCTQNLKLWFSAACRDWIHTVPKFCLLEARVYVHAATPGSFFQMWNSPHSSSFWCFPLVYQKLPYNFCFPPNLMPNQSIQYPIQTNYFLQII